MPLKKKMKRVTSDKTYVQLTFDHALDLVLSVKKAEGLRDRTLEDYQKLFGYFRAWVEEFHPDIEFVNDVTQGILRDYILYLKHDTRRYAGHKFIDADKQRVGLSDVTINIRIRTLKAIFNQLHRDEHIEVNPTHGVKLMRQDIDLTNDLTDDEVRAILSIPNQREYVGFRDYVAICCLLDSGLRVSELLSLRISDIDFQTRFIVLPAERNKNRKQRMVPISAQTTKLLLQLIEENRQHFSTDRIFLSSFGEPMGVSGFNKRLKYYGEKAGISEKKLTAHVYRHTWAKNMVLNGADLFSLQKMGGWSDVRTVRRYVQMNTADIRRSHDENTPINKFLPQKK